jgi:hypothetical protein
VLLCFSKYCRHICCQKSLVAQNNTKTQLLSYKKTRPFHGHCLFKNNLGFSVSRPIVASTGHRPYHLQKLKANLIAARFSFSALSVFPQLKAAAPRQYRTACRGAGYAHRKK